MKKIIYVCSMLMVSFFSMHAFAEIYRSVDANGVVTYSDQPHVGAQAVVLPAENIAKQSEKSTTETTDTVVQSSIDANEATAKTEKTLEKKVDYTTFVIGSPKDQETFQNQTNLAVSVTVNPTLQSGDAIQFYLDDAAVGNPSSSTSLIISRSDNKQEILTRGTHTIHAVILNAQGNAIKTTPNVTIFLHYATIKQS